MISREASSPPEYSASSTPIPAVYNSTPPPNKKRKHAGISSIAHSPAPSEQSLTMGEPVLGVVAANVHASESRPRLTVSRGPVFVPVTEGSVYHTTDQIPINRLGFRYAPAGLAHPGSRIPYRTIESRPHDYVRVSWEDRSPFLKVTTDGLGLCGEKGFRSARLNVPVREGRWYMEVKIEHGGGDHWPESPSKDGAHVRLGWGRREAQLNGPVGLDGYSYGYRDKSGDKVTLSRPRPYGNPFRTGDVIGMYISLPPKRKPKVNDPYDPAHIKRERIAIDFKGQEYFESLEYAQSKEMIALTETTNNKSKSTASLPSSSKKSATVKNVPERGRGNKTIQEPTQMKALPVLRGSCIAFFVNGESQGVAFQDLFDYLQLRTVPSARKDRSKRRLREGMVEHTENHFDDGWLGYYPFISLYNGARVHLNSGPDFDYPPPADIEGILMGDPDSADTKTRTWRPLCERYTEFMAEQWALDALEENEAKTQALLRANDLEQSKLGSRPRPPKVPRSQPKSEPKPLVETEPKSQEGPETNSTTVTEPVAQRVMTEAEAKIIMRKERKRLLERQRRARKAEEARAAKAREMQAEAERLGLSISAEVQPASIQTTLPVQVETASSLHIDAHSFNSRIHSTVQNIDSDMQDMC